ncbi:MurR/RpiR family transcriptional regulator [Streptomyces nigra]
MSRRDEPSTTSERGPAGASGADAVTRIRAGRPTLPPSLRRVADAVIADPAGSSELSIGALAERAATSPATVLRFCRTQGAGGVRVGERGDGGGAGAAAVGEQGGQGVVAGEYHQAQRGLAGDEGAVLAAGAQALQDQADVAAAGVAGVGGQLLQRHLLGTYVACDMGVCPSVLGVLGRRRRISGGASSALRAAAGRA